MTCKVETEIETFGRKSKLRLSWSDGMIGAAPIFDTREDAERYANGKAQVYEVEEQENE